MVKVALTINDVRVLASGRNDENVEGDFKQCEDQDDRIASLGRVAMNVITPGESAVLKQMEGARKKHML